MQIDPQRIIDTIVALPVGALAREEGAELVQAWIDEEAGFADRILAVEVGWSVRLAEKVWVVGVIDLIAADTKGVYGREHKTSAAPTRYWNCDKWLQSIMTGPQIGIYALALKKGTFYDDGRTFSFEGLSYPIRMKVQAITKSATPQFWPENEEDSWREFSEADLAVIWNGLMSKAEQLRAAKKLGFIPYQLTGRQCHEWNRPCEYWEECSKGKYQQVEGGFDMNNPAWPVLASLPPESRDPDAIILTASSYQTATTCAEKYRREAGGGNREEPMALQLGTVLHEGAACFYRQIQEAQQKELTTVRTLE